MFERCDIAFVTGFRGSDQLGDAFVRPQLTPVAMSIQATQAQELIDVLPRSAQPDEKLPALGFRALLIGQHRHPMRRTLPRVRRGGISGVFVIGLHVQSINRARRECAAARNQ
jgi:hypothetical protein